ncbi:polyketide synthase [Fusarium avenaceum]|nr:polyketide synthase [Fusarium avenaceum]
MSGNAGDSLIIRVAKPTVRLKGKEHEYGETQDFDVFTKSGRPETDVMDDDRWLDYPKISHPTNLIAINAGEIGAVIATAERLDPEDLLIWNPTTPNSNRANEVYRVPQEQHVVYNLLPRACALQKDYGPASWNNIDKKLSDSKFKDCVPFVFVGISALNCQPVVMMRDDLWDGTEVELESDNIKSVVLKTLPELPPCKKEIIWLENMMIPGNISYVKKALWGRLTGAAKKRFLEDVGREHNLLAGGLNPSGVAALLPSNEEQNRKPSLLEIPSAMLDALDRFLFKFSFDNVPLNIAIAAVIVFFDLKKNRGGADAFLSSNTTSRPQETTLAKFIIYFPHMLRFVEVSSNYRVTLIPASMPGTSMVFPIGSDAEKPTPGLFALCCLNDVRTLGVPSYRNINSNHPGFYQRIGGPMSLFTERLSLPKFKLSAKPPVDYWNPEKDTKIMALTGRAKRIGPIFPDCDSDYYTKETMTPIINSRFGASNYYRQNFPLREALASSIRRQTFTINNELNRIADYFRVPFHGRQVNPKTLLLDWGGIDAHLQNLIEKGDLEKVAEGRLRRATSPEAHTPHAKRIKTQEHELDPTISTQITGLIDKLPAKSRGWHALEAYIALHPTPTVKGAQDMLLCVCNSISDIDNTFSTEISNELVDDLDIFIRMSFRAAGLFDKREVALLNYETNWAEHREAFSKFSPTIGNAIEVIYRLRGPGGFALAYPQIKFLRESSLISAQLDAFKAIEDLLEEQAAETD